MLLVYLGCIPYAKGLVVELVPSHAQSAWGSIGRGRGGGKGSSYGVSSISLKKQNYQKQKEK